MIGTQQFSITLPVELAEAVDNKIRFGGYGSVDDVMRDALRVLLQRDAVVDRWIREELVAGHIRSLAEASEKATS